ncbi:hypothetical protein B0H10DRAFT_650911 [Mycena sp. CBHHK59/15]|nr:hypothetical protein B0H10DRAFT_650911 [Mycena sp. CBHHK59/15]
MQSLTPEQRIAFTPYPYIGVSKLSCFQCTLYFEAYKACGFEPAFQTCGSHTEVLACALPASSDGHDKTNEAIEKVMGAQLENIIGRLLVEEMNRQRKRSMSPVDSTGSSPKDSPPQFEDYVEESNKFNSPSFRFEESTVETRWIDG